MARLREGRPDERERKERERGPARPVTQFHHADRAIYRRGSSARRSSVLAVGHVSASNRVVRMRRISRTTRGQGSRNGTGR